MKDSKSVEDYYNRVILLLNQMRLNGETIEHKRVIEKIPRSLTRKFEYVVVAIEESKDLSTLSFESLLGTLQLHELRMKQFDSLSLEQAFQLLSPSQESTHDKARISEQSNNECGESSYKGRGCGRPLSQIHRYHCQMSKVWSYNQILQKKTYRRKQRVKFYYFTHKEEIMIDIHDV